MKKKINVDDMPQIVVPADSITKTKKKTSIGKFISGTHHPIPEVNFTDKPPRTKSQGSLGNIRIRSRNNENIIPEKSTV
jgi:hypothetical protein